MAMSWPSSGIMFRPWAFSTLLPRERNNVRRRAPRLFYKLPGREVIWLQVASYASVESCAIERKLFIGEIYEDDRPDVDVPDMAHWSYDCSVTWAGRKTLALLASA